MDYLLLTTPSNILPAGGLVFWVPCCLVGWLGSPTLLSTKGNPQPQGPPCIVWCPKFRTENKAGKSPLDRIYWIANLVLGHEPHCTGRTALSILSFYDPARISITLHYYGPFSPCVCPFMAYLILRAKLTASVHGAKLVLNRSFLLIAHPKRV